MAIRFLSIKRGTDPAPARSGKRQERPFPRNQQRFRVTALALSARAYLIDA